MPHPSVKRALPLGDALSPTIARLRDMAAQSYDTLLLAEGPPEPDCALLDLCAETLHAIKLASAANDAIAATSPPPDRGYTDDDRARRFELVAEWKALDNNATKLLRRVSKLKATTAAGIYAKALVCRSSAGGSALLAHSLADDFISCDGLRASLWPAERVA